MSDTKLKILYIDFAIPYLLKDSDFPAGGAAVEWLSWIEGIKQNGHEIGVLAWKGAKKFIDKDLDFDIIESYELNKGIHFLRIFYYWFPKILYAVKNYKPDVIVQEGSGILTFLGAISSKILGRRFVYRVASDKDVDERIKTKLNKREYFFYRIALKITDGFICQNAFQYKILRGKYNRKKVSVLHNPFSIKNNLGNGSIKRRSFIAWIGNFRYDKNIAALVPIAKSFPNLKFKVAGKSSSNIDNASQKALEELKILENVEFVGYLKRSEIIPFLSNATALLNTSYLEGFSNTFLEAWTTGTPVITTKNVNPDNIIIKFGLGEVAENYNELPAKIKAIIEAGEDTERKLRCRRYVETNHNPEILAKKLIQFIKQIIMIKVTKEFLYRNTN